MQSKYIKNKSLCNETALILLLDSTHNVEIIHSSTEEQNFDFLTKAFVSVTFTACWKLNKAGRHFTLHKRDISVLKNKRKCGVKRIGVVQLLCCAIIMFQLCTS